MKIAILTCRDFIIPGGAERLEIDIAIALKATIVCLTVDSHFFEVYPVAKEVTFYQIKRKLPNEPFKQILGMNLFRKLKLPYDFFIIMDDMALRYLIHPVPHIYYMHTPRRIFYDMYYPSIKEFSLIKKLFMIFTLNFFRFLDQRFIRKNVMNIACNSHNTRNRIWKFYQRNATVLYPPVHIEQYSNKNYGDFWLSVTRVDKWKRIELQMDAFRMMPSKKLIIAGKIYPQYKKLVQNAPNNVIFLNVVNDETLSELYSTCRGFITTAIDEDFGITPLEAMASGKPVVGVKEGGYLETVIEGTTGLLVAPETEEIVHAVKEIDKNPALFSTNCRKRAELFDYQIFKEKLITYVHTCCEKQIT